MHPLHPPPRSAPERTVCCHIDLFTVFSTVEMDKLWKTRHQHSKECLKIGKIAKSEHDLMKTNEDTPPQSRKFYKPLYEALPG